MWAISKADKDWQTENHVTVEDKENFLSPFTQFSDLNLEHRFTCGYENFDKPTPIQGTFLENFYEKCNQF